MHFKENGVAHHTDKYDAMIRRVIPQDLVIRRGQEFVVTLSLSRPFQKDLDGMSFVFSIVGEFILMVVIGVGIHECKIGTKVKNAFICTRIK